MAAAAGALGVQLEKQGHYILGGEFRLPDRGDVELAARLVGIAAVFQFLSVIAGLYIR